MNQPETNLDSLFRPVNRSMLQKQKVIRPKRTYANEIVRKVVKNKLAVVGFILLTIIILLSIIGPHMVPYSPSKQSLTQGNLSLSSKHWFGTDDLGRDVWSRTWAGARISLIIGFSAALIDLVIGVFVGGISGYMVGRSKVGDRIDSVLMRIVEILYGIPYLLVVILLLVIMKPGLGTIILALSITGWVRMVELRSMIYMSLFSQMEERFKL